MLLWGDPELWAGMGLARVSQPSEEVFGGEVPCRVPLTSLAVCLPAFPAPCQDVCTWAGPSLPSRCFLSP